MSPIMRTVLAVIGGLLAVVALYFVVGVLGIGIGLVGLMFALMLARGGDLFQIGSLTRTRTDDRQDARKARVEAARRKNAAGGTTAKVDEVKSETNSEPEPITDYWSLPRTGPRTTLINSAWTWTTVIYVLILAAVLLTISQQNLNIFERGWLGIVILVSLLYPAWRIGSLLSRFLKRRGIGTDFDMPGIGKGAEEADPNSVKARMAARRARVEKAREEGKL